ncbi:DUF814 domain-containing protein [Candidatus Woesearchaeota archaeon]|nr:DUF814 domain-containing protein [Candidatus Woesearchaeota archaeon]
MQLKLNINKTVEQNAAMYFELAKKAKKKLEGANKAIAENKKKLELLVKEQEKKEIDTTEQNSFLPKAKKNWYEKFRWFYSSEGFLAIGGRDSTSNEIVIKKHTDKDDLVFHTDMAGSPFFVIKADGKEIGKQTIQETADATACFSRAWKLGLATTDVFFVKPEQVSKEANAGEYMPKGAFMVRGKTNYINPVMKLAIGLKDNQLISGPAAAIQAQTKDVLILLQGKEKPSDIAKLIKKKFGKELAATYDDIIRMLPAGGCKVEKEKR